MHMGLTPQDIGWGLKSGQQKRSLLLKSDAPGHVNVEQMNLAVLRRNPPFGVHDDAGIVDAPIFPRLRDRAPDDPDVVLDSRPAKHSGRGALMRGNCTRDYCG